MTDFRVQQIDHVEVFVPDRYEAAEWFRAVLGLELVTRMEHWAEYPRGPLMISSDDGNTMLALFEGPAQDGVLPTGHKLIAFRVSGEGFMDFLGRLESLSLSDQGGKRVTAASAVDHGAAYSVYFTDPYGNAYEVTTYDTDSVKAGR